MNEESLARGVEQLVDIVLQDVVAEGMNVRVLSTGSKSMQRTNGAFRLRYGARMLAPRLFPTPHFPCSERWTLPAALISIPSFGNKVRFLLSD